MKNTLNLNIIIVNVNKKKISIETQILLFIKYFCEINDSQFIFIDNYADSCAFSLSENFEIDKYDYELGGNYQLCELPLYIDEVGIIHSGLCNVVRKIISKCQNFKYLLGTTGSCLKACAEVSNWTKYIEVDFPFAIKKIILHNSNILPDLEFESDAYIFDIFDIFESHLNSLPVISNISKLQHQNKKLKNTNIFSYFGHIRYAEGLDFLLTDLLLFCYISICLNLNSIFLTYVQDKCSNICKWYNNVLENNSSIKHAAESCGFKTYCLSYVEHIHQAAKSVLNNKLNLDKYDRNMKVIPRDIELSLFTYEALKSKLDVDLFKNFDSIFNEIASLIYIEDNFPIKRREQKLQQLHNMAASVLCLNPQSGKIIVDFCCGSGHLGILMANLLPNCKIILIENKEESLERAFKQAQKLDLKNITFIRSNIGYFKGSFDIGICLHGCGLVTDLVLNKCFAVKANYVICPCCYGATKNTEYIKYPRSQNFRLVNCSSYHHIIQAADTPVVTQKSIEAKNSELIKSASNNGLYSNDIISKEITPKIECIHISSTHTKDNESENLALDQNLILTTLYNIDNINKVQISNDIDNTINIECLETLASNGNSSYKQVDIDTSLMKQYMSKPSSKDVNITSLECSLDSDNFVENSFAVETCLTKRCMYIVDMDRQLYARELGYQVDIKSMIPKTCTPKNNILIGKFLGES